MSSHLLVQIPILFSLLLSPLPLEGVLLDEPAGSLAALEREFEKNDLRGPDGAEAFRARFEKLARDRAGSEDGLGAELWLLRMTWWKRQEGTMATEACAQARRLMEEYGSSRQLGRIAEFHYLYGKDQVDAILSELMAVSPHDSVKAIALHGRSVAARGSREEQTRAAAIPLLEKLQSQYGSLPWRYITFGEIAEAMLSPHPKESLQIGKIAPDIVGSNVVGRPMSLHEHRGKVVVLDFWGDW